MDEMDKDINKTLLKIFGSGFALFAIIILIIYFSV